MGRLRGRRFESALPPNNGIQKWQSRFRVLDVRCPLNCGRNSGGDLTAAHSHLQTLTDRLNSLTIPTGPLSPNRYCEVRR